ncbi:MAG: caspase family protein [Planctomycetales bacterium]|nr:caspase family protein [Planctomycetales bacterium]
MITRPFKHAFALLALLGVSLVSDRAARADNFALVIGVNTCSQFKINGRVAIPLRGAKRDATRFSTFLVDRLGFPKDHVVTLLEEQATHDRVVKEMAELLAKVTAEDHLVFYFAGHGTRKPDEVGGDEQLGAGGDGFDEALCLYDCTAQGDRLLVDDDLQQWFNKLGSDRVTVVLDCCHSGGGAKSATDDETPVSRNLPLAIGAPSLNAKASWSELASASKGAKRVVAFYACDSSQSAYERPFRVPVDGDPQAKGEWVQLGQFTQYLIAAMEDPSADANHDGKMSVGETMDYVRAHIDEDFNSKRPERKQQTPTFEAGRTTWEWLTAE